MATRTRAAAATDRRTTGSVPRVGPGLREKLTRVTRVRALLVTLLLASAVGVNAGDLEALREPAFLAMCAAVAATYAATLVYNLLLRYALELERLARAQLVGDALLAGGLVYLTGGAESAFIFLFFLSIITGAHLLGRLGALFSASAASVVYAVMMLAQTGRIPLLRTVSFGVETGVVGDYVPVVHVTAFYAVALLAGHLAERLGQVGSELELRWTDIQKLRALNQNIVNSVAGGLCTLDLMGRIISFNHAAERITGRAAAEVLGHPLDEVLPELADALEASDDLGDAVAESPPEELRFEQPDGQQRFLELSVAPLTDTAGRQDGWILYFSDVTEVRRLRDILQRQRRMAALGKLSASIAHEIRNPLASISGSVQMLREVSAIGPSEQRLMDIVVREIDRLNQLIEEFLLYARPRTLHPTSVDVKSLVEECMLLLKRDTALFGGLETRIDTPGEPVIVQGDADAIRQVLINLIRNAAEAMEGRGRLYLHVSPVGRAPARAVTLAVRDSGPGLSADAKSRLFEPFFTTKPKGTGLGLATAHRLVESHGGMIWAEEDEELGGTAFRVLLPVQPPPARPDNETGSAGRSAIAGLPGRGGDG